HSLHQRIPPFGDFGCLFPDLGDGCFVVRDHVGQLARAPKQEPGRCIKIFPLRHRASSESVPRLAPRRRDVGAKLEAPILHWLANNSQDAFASDKQTPYRLLSLRVHAMRVWSICYPAQDLRIYYVDESEC